MQRRYHIIGAIILTVLALTGCQSLKPNARIFNHVPANAPQAYKQGWKDGCTSGFSAAGNDLYRISYRYTMNINMTSVPLYMQGWQDAEPYCRHYAMSSLWEGNQLGASPTSKTADHGGIFGLLASWRTGLVYHTSVDDPWDHFFGVNKNRGLF